MADSCPQPLLPAFAIRDLNGAETPPAVVQITAHQYDSTVQTEPDVVLSYMDDDDGELITVGSSFELEQRLDEPARHSTMPIPMPLKTSPDAEDSMMHIFDIQHNGKSLTTWKNYEAYTSKKMTSGGPPATAGKVNQYESTSPQSQSAPKASAHEASMGQVIVKPDQSTKDSLLSNLNAPPAMSEHATSGATPTAPKSGRSSDKGSSWSDNQLFELFDNLGLSLAPIANMLDTAAVGLRQVADKTAKAEPVPVEDLLSGLKAIIADVGELGREVLATLDLGLDHYKANRENDKIETSVSKPVAQPSPFVPSHVSGKAEAPLKAEASAKKVYFIDTTPFSAEQKADSVNAPAPPARRCSGSKISFHLPGTQKPMLSERSQHNPLHSVGSYLTETEALRPSNTKASILDLEPSEPDFSARYPPLLSLRKAKSVGGLHNKSQVPSSLNHTGMNAASASTRYPTIGQFEQQTRLKPVATFDEKQDSRYNAAVGVTSPGDVPKSRKTEVYKKPSVEDDLVLEQAGKKSKGAMPDIKNNTALPPTSVPGAWPEHKAEELHPVGAATTQSYLDSIISVAPNISAASTRAEISEGLSQRAYGPISDMYHRAETASLPRRYHTVGGTNPAARLNGPFDPLVPLISHHSDRPAGGRSAAYTPTWMTSNDYPALDKRRPTHSTLTAEDRRPNGQPEDFTYPYAPGNGDWSCSPPISAARHADALSRAQSTSARYRHVAGHSPQFSRLRARHADFFRPSFDGLTTKPSVVRPSSDSTTVGLAPPVPTQTRLSSLTIPIDTQVRYKDSSPEAGRPALSTTSSRMARPSLTLSPIITPTPYTRPRGRSGASAPAPTSTALVDLCVKNLKAMGYGVEDCNEMSRLTIYASAAAGDIATAIEMIEEDREAAKELTER
ncbi:hypothetical protein A1O1_03020 [Capronia coronata CBS 617.96]|uniref:Uncharacterized protein n=1 Tax=Capronia coronata CBS 617.96 TaxID=1182541 RepID=W9ZJE6_9EURO|nr:uncharacterized protein A1O1_03020 [Capronia coronata CBS 617.96]EXJ94624.1 hypothetical protein A1O1_03020 [Capronia coronata CBS 617.96]